MSRFNVADATKLQSRDGGISKGGLIRNGFVEIARNGEKWAWMRPALSTSVAAPLTGRGLGMFFVGTTLWGMYGTGTGTGATNVTSSTIVFPPPTPNRAFSIAGGTNVNVYNEALARWADAGTTRANYTVTITADIVSANVAVAALVWGTGWASGCTFSLVANANVTGKGGNGGAGGSGLPGDGVNGEAGGNAFEKQGNTVSVSGSGVFKGGGGGGGGGGAAGGGGSTQGDGGGGGAGAAVGSGGAGPDPGVDGTATTGGAGGTTGAGGVGGDGGNLETAGTDGGPGAIFPTPSAGGIGGAAGQGIAA